MKYILVTSAYNKNMEYPKQYGKGEWTADTLEDAKRMAIDFADGVR